jgi:hypothetical protein
MLIRARPKRLPKGNTLSAASGAARPSNGSQCFRHRDNLSPTIAAGYGMCVFGNPGIYQLMGKLANARYEKQPASVSKSSVRSFAGRGIVYHGRQTAMTKITVTYRRDDLDAITGRIFDRLRAHYGVEAVFRDIDNVPLGIDYRKYISGELASTDILLAIVGPKWAGKMVDGKSRLEQETDLVRIEVEAAFRKGIPVVPVLVGNAAMPQPADLPDGLKDFAFRNAARVDAREDFEDHVGRLIRRLDRLLESPSFSGEQGTARPSTPANRGLQGNKFIQELIRPLRVQLFSGRKKAQELATANKNISRTKMGDARAHLTPAPILALQAKSLTLREWMPAIAFSVCAVSACTLAIFLFVNEYSGFALLIGSFALCVTAAFFEKFNKARKLRTLTF